jgi:DNA-binding PadR family transcriptional regulator
VSTYLDVYLDYRGRLRGIRRDAVLEFITAHPDSSGYQIHKGSGVVVSWTYVVLDELVRDGRIEARWLDGPQPRRRVYRAVVR